MKVFTEGILKVLGLFILALITDWIFFWIVFWIMLGIVIIANIWLFIYPQPTTQSKIKAIRELLENKADKN